MKQLLKSRKELILLVAVLFAHLVLLSAQATQAQTTPLLRSWSMQVVSPVLKHFVGTLATLSRVWYGYIDLRNAREENRFIKNQLAESRQTLILYEEKIKELGRLQVLSELEADLKVRSVKARIIGGDSTQWYNSRIIDQGLDAGITRDCASLTPEGVIGRVVYVSKKSAIIQLITDSDSGVGVLLENSRAQGVLKGAGRKEAYIEYIGTNEKVTVGEKVLTSGLDQIYPKGLLVGYVKSAAPTKGIFQKIEVIIAANVQKLEEVLVLKKESVS